MVLCWATGFLSAHFRESSIYLFSCSPSLLECNAMCVYFHTRLHLELDRSDKIFNYDPHKRLSSEPLLGGLQSVSKAGNRFTLGMNCISQWLASLPIHELSGTKSKAKFGLPCQLFQYVSCFSTTFIWMLHTINCQTSEKMLPHLL